MTAPSSKAVIKDRGISLWRIIILSFSVLFILFFLWFEGSLKPDPFIEKTLNLKGSKDNGSNIFKMNCVGCHGISAQGLVGPDLHKVTTRLNDKQIINQVVKGLTPPMPSFEIDSQSMADLLVYMQSLE